MYDLMVWKWWTSVLFTPFYQRSMKALTTSVSAFTSPRVWKNWRESFFSEQVFFLYFFLVVNTWNFMRSPRLLWTKRTCVCVMCRAPTGFSIRWCVCIMPVGLVICLLFLKFHFLRSNWKGSFVMSEQWFKANTNMKLK